MSLFTRKRKANLLTDMEIDEISLVKRGANQHSKVVLCKRADGDDEEDASEFVRETDGGAIEVMLEGEWTNLDDLDDDDFEDVMEQMGIDPDDLEDEDDEDDDEGDDEFIELDDDAYEEADDEPLPALAKLSKSAAEGSALATAASERVVEIIDKAAEDIVAIDGRYVGRPRSERDSVRRVMVLKDNPDVYDDWRELRDTAVGAVAKSLGAQEQTRALMASVNARAASLSKSDEGKGLSPAQLRLKVIQSDPEIAKAYKAIQFEKVRQSA